LKEKEGVRVEISLPDIYGNNACEHKALGRRDESRGAGRKTEYVMLLWLEAVQHRGSDVICESWACNNANALPQNRQRLK
jgi:hypothetical protein